NRAARILHVISQRPDYTGSGIYLQAILKEAARHGYDNALVAATQSGCPAVFPAVSEELCHLLSFNNETHPGAIVGMSDVMPYPSRKFRDLDTVEINRYLGIFADLLSRAVSAHNPDIIHSHHLWLLSSIIKKLFPDIPLITSCHGSDIRQFNLCAHLRNQVREGCSRIDRVLALSTEQKQEIITCYRLPGNKIDVTGAGYDQDIFYRRSNVEKPDKRTILYAGKLSRAKGVPWLLKALSEIDPCRYHLHLVGGGSGVEFEECRAAAAALSSSCSLHGMLSQHQLASLMRSSALFILPSLHEGLPLVVLEALACGCTVIATDLPGTREIQKQLRTSQLHLVDRPTIVDTAATILADEKPFTASLKRSIEHILSQDTTDTVRQSELSYFSWDSVFRRVEESWFKVLN
ncbi:MAG: glycosyltransferase family 4 protein, partial [Desulfocapsaceae bacterium]|nr:glycosyltransferase family 4 protein [Desulfocapsaceae bacterium]